jgi:Holliday junction resolvase RusA-like endonuclease
MLMVTFKVDGTPIPKGRPRFARKGKFVSTYTDKTTLQYEDLIADGAKRAMGLSEPLETALEVFFYFSIPIPKSYSKKRTDACLSGLERPMKKDLDNLIKSVADGMNKIVYKDDAQIVALHATKVYGDPYVEVLIREAE